METTNEQTTGTPQEGVGVQRGVGQRTAWEWHLIYDYCDRRARRAAEWHELLGRWGESPYWRYWHEMKLSVARRMGWTPHD